MEAKKTKEKGKGSKRQRERRKNILLNFLGMLGLTIPLVWAVVVIYNNEKETESMGTNEGLRLSTLETIEPNKVCMSTDAFMGGAPQIVVPNMDDKFYACSQHCIVALQSNEGERYAIDPVSKNQISKAKAFICLHPDRSGRVCYFESKENQLAFLKTQSK